MREIKFRAWIKNQNKIALVSEWNMWNLGHIFTVDECGFHDKTVGNANYRLMQYTGLKDKNGVEIYEGDICEVDIYPNFLYSLETERRIYEVAFVRGAFRLLRNSRGTSIHFDKTKSYKVVGNIYENPELLQ